MRVHALHQPSRMTPCASAGCARRGPRVRRAARWRGRGIRAVDRQPAHGDSEGQNGRAGRRCSVRARQATWRSRPRTSRAPLARLGSRRAQERKRKADERGQKKGRVMRDETPSFFHARRRQQMSRTLARGCKLLQGSCAVCGLGWPQRTRAPRANLGAACIRILCLPPLGSICRSSSGPQSGPRRQTGSRSCIVRH
jgi:hypothetical protein